MQVVLYDGFRSWSVTLFPLLSCEISQRSMDHDIIVVHVIRRAPSELIPYCDAWQDTGKNSNESRSLSGQIYSVQFSMWAHVPAKREGKKSESSEHCIFMVGRGSSICSRVLIRDAATESVRPTFRYLGELLHACMHTHTHSDAIVWNNEVVLKQRDHHVFVIGLSGVIAGFQVNGPIKLRHCWG